MTGPDPLAWLRTGPGPVRTLLLHGFTDSAACWMPFMHRHPELGGFLATDARGHGRSPLPAGSVGPRQQAADNAAVLRDLSVDHPVLVLGHSMGAVTATALAAEHPELVSVLILEDPPLGTAQASIRGVPSWLTEVRALDTPARIAYARAENPAWHDDELPAWADSKADIDLDFCLRPGETVDIVTDLLSRVTCPTLLIAGNADRGALVTAEDLTRAVDAAGPHLATVTIDTAGHSIRRDDPEAFDATIRSYLREIAR